MMNSSKLIFAQLMEHIPAWQFQECVARYQGDRYVKTFSCRDQFLAMAFAQLTARESLRDIEACLQAQHRKLYGGEDFGVELEGAAYALDLTTIDLCLSVFPWASFRSAKGGVKML